MEFLVTGLNHTASKSVDEFNLQHFFNDHWRVKNDFFTL